jgi:hypothetical protein
MFGRDWLHIREEPLRVHIKAMQSAWFICIILCNCLLYFALFDLIDSPVGESRLRVVLPTIIAQSRVVRTKCRYRGNGAFQLCPVDFCNKTF